MTNPVIKTLSDIVTSANTIFIIICFMEGFAMDMKSEKQIIPDSDLRNLLIENIIKLSKENQGKVFRKALELGFFKNKKDY